MKKLVAIVLFIVVAIASAWAFDTVYFDRTTATPCNRDAVFARTIGPEFTGFYYALDCETVLADAVTVVLPPLTGTTKLKQIRVLNIGVREVKVQARAEDVINPSVVGYGVGLIYPDPNAPILSGGESSLGVLPGTSLTLTAMQTSVSNAWFVVR